MYFKKTRDVNFFRYKFVFEFMNSVSKYVYMEFILPKLMTIEPNFETYFVTENKKLIIDMVGESDFNLQSTISCLDPKLAFNGHKNLVIKSAFSSSNVPTTPLLGGGQLYNPNAIHNN